MEGATDRASQKGQRENITEKNTERNERSESSPRSQEGRAASATRGHARKSGTWPSREQQGGFRGAWAGPSERKLLCNVEPDFAFLLCI